MSSQPCADWRWRGSSLEPNGIGAMTAHDSCRGVLPLLLEIRTAHGHRRPGTEITGHRDNVCRYSGFAALCTVVTPAEQLRLMRRGGSLDLSRPLGDQADQRKLTGIRQLIERRALQPVDSDTGGARLAHDTSRPGVAILYVPHRIIP